MTRTIEPAVRPTLPRPFFLMTLGVVGLAAIVAVANVSGREPGAAAGNGVADTAGAVRHVDLRFSDVHGVGLSAIDASSGRVIERYELGKDGFVRGVLRSLFRERRLAEAGNALPLRLTQWDDGRLTLDDPETGRRIDLLAFGSTNIAAFGRLLGPQTSTQATAPTRMTAPTITGGSETR